jgi:hypothetical protein
MYLKIYKVLLRKTIGKWSLVSCKIMPCIFQQSIFGLCSLFRRESILGLLFKLTLSYVQVEEIQSGLLSLLQMKYAGIVVHRGYLMEPS